jgi:uncharacterized protein
MKRLLLLLAVAFIGLTVFYGHSIEPFELEINHLYPDSPALNALLSGRTAVHVSDLHLAADDKRAGMVLEAVNRLKPDFIFLTGDYVRWDGDYEPAMEFLARLEAPLGVWAVMGDYDYSNGRKSCLFCHESGTGAPANRHKVRFLRNSTERIQVGEGGLVITGIEGKAVDPRLNGRTGWMEAIPENVPTIVLTHSPIPFERFEPERDALVLAGDTHGGQVPVPEWLWSLLGYEKTAAFSHGFFQKGRSLMYVSKGVGTSHFQFRLLRKPEIAVVHF